MGLGFESQPDHKIKRDWLIWVGLFVLRTHCELKNLKRRKKLRQKSDKLLRGLLIYSSIIYSIFYSKKRTTRYKSSKRFYINAKTQQICHVLANYELWIVFGRSGCAVGLSAISFSASLQKDAAPIPNALAAAIKQMLLSDLVRTWYDCDTKERHNLLTLFLRGWAETP